MKNDKLGVTSRRHAVAKADVHKSKVPAVHLMNDPSLVYHLQRHGVQRCEFSYCTPYSVISQFHTLVILRCSMPRKLSDMFDGNSSTEQTWAWSDVGVRPAAERTVQHNDAPALPELLMEIRCRLWQPKEFENLTGKSPDKNSGKISYFIPCPVHAVMHGLWRTRKCTALKQVMLIRLHAQIMHDEHF